VSRQDGPAYRFSEGEEGEEDEEDEEEGNGGGETKQELKTTMRTRVDTSTPRAWRSTFERSGGHLYTACLANCGEAPSLQKMFAGFGAAGESATGGSCSSGCWINIITPASRESVWEKGRLQTRRIDQVR